MSEQYIVDAEGNMKEVILDIDSYQQLVDAAGQLHTPLGRLPKVATLAHLIATRQAGMLEPHPPRPDLDADLDALDALAADIGKK